MSAFVARKVTSILPPGQRFKAKLFRQMPSRSAKASSTRLFLLEHQIGGLVEELRFVALFEFSEPSQNGGPLLCGQLGKLGNDFRCTHVENLPLPHISSKPYDDWFTPVLGRAVAGLRHSRAPVASLCGSRTLLH
ncbi:MAG: hypothetical protein DME24_07000 [Verrucomicrobia bacterium]|nr:MAG: hypothetical protein DME24_07000 [Verrucomicrobiota bacterium]